MYMYLFFPDHGWWCLFWQPESLSKGLPTSGLSPLQRRSTLWVVERLRGALVAAAQTPATPPAFPDSCQTPRLSRQVRQGWPQAIGEADAKRP
jgi:hypothetical protein